MPHTLGLYANTPDIWDFYTIAKPNRYPIRLLNIPNRGECLARLGYILSNFFVP